MDGRTGGESSLRRRAGVEQDIDGDSALSGAMRLGDPERAAEVLRENQDSMKAKVTRALGGAALAWSDARAPCLANLRALHRHLQDLDHTAREAILRPPPPQTALEGRQGAKLVLESVYDCTMLELAAFFAEQVLPVRLKPDSRKEYDRAWRSFVTYAVVYESLGDVFPTKRPLLYGYVSHLLPYQYAASTIIKHISAVVAHNKDYGHNVLGYGDLRRYTDDIKGVLVSSVQCTRFRLFPHHLQAITRLDGGTNRTRLRDACMIMVGTVGACRKSELLEVDVCD